MKNYYLYILFLLAISFNTSLSAQDSEEDAVEVSTVEQLLMLVKEGKTKEQSENSKREAKFMAEKNNQASILAAEKALCEYGWSINLSGGYHHASARKGGGFCIYADISLIIVNLMKKYSNKLKKIMILDLDAHQGNGHGNDKANNIYSKCGANVYTVDFW